MQAPEVRSRRLETNANFCSAALRLPKINDAAILRLASACILQEELVSHPDGPRQGEQAAVGVNHQCVRGSGKRNTIRGAALDNHRQLRKHSL